MKIPVKWIVYSYIGTILICKMLFAVYFIMLGKYISILIFKNFELLHWALSTIFVWIALRYLMPLLYILLIPLRFILITLIYKGLMLFRRHEILEPQDINYQLNISNNFVENMILWIIPGVIFYAMGNIRSIFLITIVLYILTVFISYVDLTLEYTEKKFEEPDKNSENEKEDPK